MRLSYVYMKIAELGCNGILSVKEKIIDQDSMAI